MSGVIEFKIYEGKLKHNILKISKNEIDFRKLIGDTYNIAYYKDLMNRNIITVVDDNGYVKNLKTTFVLGKKLPEGIKVYSEYELKGNVYMAKYIKNLWRNTSLIFYLKMIYDMYLTKFTNIVAVIY